MIMKTEVTYKPEVIKNLKKQLAKCDANLKILDEIIQEDKSVSREEIRQCATSETIIRETLENLYTQLIKPDNIMK